MKICERNVQKGNAFNRTIQELKFAGLNETTELLKTFNRTIQELKSLGGVNDLVKVFPFNRTIQELE